MGSTSEDFEPIGQNRGAFSASNGSVVKSNSFVVADANESTGVATFQNSVLDLRHAFVGGGIGAIPDGFPALPVVPNVGPMGVGPLTVGKEGAGNLSANLSALIASDITIGKSGNGQISLSAGEVFAFGTLVIGEGKSGIATIDGGNRFRVNASIRIGTRDIGVANISGTNTFLEGHLVYLGLEEGSNGTIKEPPQNNFPI